MNHVVDYEAIARLMVALRLTGKRLAADSGMNRGYVSKLIHGKVTPSANARAAIRGALEGAGADRGHLDTILPQTPTKATKGPSHALYVQKTPPETWDQVHAGALAVGMTVRAYVIALWGEAAATGSHPLDLVRAAGKRRARRGSKANGGGTDDGGS